MKRALIMLVAGILAAGCGSDGGDDGDDDAGQTDPPADSLAVYSSEAIDFTFEYPRELAAATEAQGQVLAQVSVEPGAQLNAIKVRRTADREVPREQYLDDFRADFGRTTDDTVEKREETIGDREMGILAFEDVVQDGGERVPIASTSYFFTGAGKTWQIECLSDDEHREQIDSACRTALESLEFERD